MIKFYSWFTILILAISLNIKAQQRAPIAMFDLSKNQIASPHSPSSSGMSMFSSSLEDIGYNIVPVYNDLKNTLNNSLEKDLLVIAIPIYAKYDSIEIRSILNFVKTGGRLLVFAEHDNAYESGTSLNKLLSPLGCTIENNGVSSYLFKTSSFWPLCHSDRFNLKDIPMYHPAELDIDESWIPLLQTSDTNRIVTGAMKSYKKGKIIVLSDYEFVWNMAEKWGMNNEIISNFFSELLNRELPLGTNEKRQLNIKPAKKIKRNFVIYDSESGYNPIENEAFLNAFHNRFSKKGFNLKVVNRGEEYQPTDKDVLLLLNPKTKEISNSQINQFNKVVLVYDGYSDFMATLLGKDIFINGPILTNLGSNTFSKPETIESSMEMQFDLKTHPYYDYLRSNGFIIHNLKLCEPIRHQTAINLSDKRKKITTYQSNFISIDTSFINYNEIVFPIKTIGEVCVNNSNGSLFIDNQDSQKLPNNYCTTSSIALMASTNKIVLLSSMYLITDQCEKKTRNKVLKELKKQLK